MSKVSAHVENLGPTVPKRVARSQSCGRIRKSYVNAAVKLTILVCISNLQRVIASVVLWQFILDEEDVFEWKKNNSTLPNPIIALCAHLNLFRES